MLCRAETNIRPWRSVLNDIKEGNKKIKWENREPYAYWKGNPHVCPWRADLMKCNATPQTDWNTRLYEQACLIRIFLMKISHFFMSKYTKLCLEYYLPFLFLFHVVGCISELDCRVPTRIQTIKSWQSVHPQVTNSAISFSFLFFFFAMSLLKE